MTQKQLALLWNPFGVVWAKWKEEEATRNGYGRNVFGYGFSKFSPPEPPQKARNQAKLRPLSPMISVLWRLWRIIFRAISTRGVNLDLVALA